jgi:hypothetical protein
VTSAPKLIWSLYRTPSGICQFPGCTHRISKEMYWCRRCVNTVMWREREWIRKAGAAKKIFVCDGCMAQIGIDEVADLVDGEHVICCLCLTKEVAPPSNVR